MKHASWLGLLLAAAPLLAMHISRSVGVAGFSDDGASVLLMVSEHGPEGGGQLSYRLVSSVEKEEHTFVFSSDFSPGGSEHPQTVTLEACQAGADALKVLLTRLKFSGFTVDRAACKGDRRHSVVTRTSAPEGQRFKGEGQKLALGALRLSVVDGKLTLTGSTGTARLVKFTADQGERMEAVMSPSNRMLLVFTRSPYNEAEFLGAFVSSGGGVADFKPLHAP